MPLIYHVTTRYNAILAQRDGLIPAWTPAEAGEAAIRAEAIVKGEPEPEEIWVEVPRERAAREVFNAILREVRYELNPNLPSHESSVFFWATRATAEYRKSLIKDPLYPLVILEVEAARIPCQLYQASIRTSDDLFDICYADPYALENVVIYGNEPDEEVQISLDEAYAIARRYYQDMRPWTGETRDDIEILAPCVVPPEAIVREIEGG